MASLLEKFNRVFRLSEVIKCEKLNKEMAYYTFCPAFTLINVRLAWRLTQPRGLLDISL